MKDKDLIKLIPPEYLIYYEVNGNIGGYYKLEIKMLISGKISFDELKSVFESAKNDTENDIQITIDWTR